MNNGTLGEISLADYKRIIAPRRRWMPMLAKMAGGLLACAVLTAAGDFSGLWTGKHARDLSMQEAMQLLESASSERWMTEIGLGATHQHVETALAKLHTVAQRSDKTGEYASVYLLNIALRSLAHIKELATLGAHPERQLRSLQTLQAEITKK